MTDTLTSAFKVTDITPTDVWLKERGTGLQPAIERTGVNYSADLQQKLNGLEPGTIIEATLKSLNTANTTWKFTSLTVIETPPASV